MITFVLCALGGIFVAVITLAAMLALFGTKH